MRASKAYLHKYAAHGWGEEEVDDAILRVEYMRAAYEALSRDGT